MDLHLFHKETFIADLHNDIPYHVSLWSRHCWKKDFQQMKLQRSMAGTCFVLLKNISHKP